jgi:hypothetical protein
METVTLYLLKNYVLINRRNVGRVRLLKFATEKNKKKRQGVGVHCFCIPE